MLVFGGVEDWHDGPAANLGSSVDRFLGCGIIIWAGDEEQSKGVDGHIGAAGTQADPTELLAVESRHDGGIDDSGDWSDQCDPESALGKLAERGAEHVGTVEGIQKKAENRNEKRKIGKDVAYEVKRALRKRS